MKRILFCLCIALLFLTSCESVNNLINTTDRAVYTTDRAYQAAKRTRTMVHTIAGPGTKETKREKEARTSVTVNGTSAADNTTHGSYNPGGPARAINSNITYRDKFTQREREAGRNISARTDPKSGAYVAKSTYNSYTFEVALGNVRVKNSTYIIEVFTYNGSSWSLVKKIDKRYAVNTPYRFNGSTNGRRQQVAISVKESGTYVTIYEDTTHSGRYTRNVGSYVF